MDARWFSRATFSNKSRASVYKIILEENWSDAQPAPIFCTRREVTRVTCWLHCPRHSKSRVERERWINWTRHNRLRVVTYSDKLPPNSSRHDRNTAPKIFCLFPSFVSFFMSIKNFDYTFIFRIKKYIFDTVC